MKRKDGRNGEVSQSTNSLEKIERQLNLEYRFLADDFHSFSTHYSPFFPRRAISIMLPACNKTLE